MDRGAWRATVHGVAKESRHHRATNTRGEICGPHRAGPREVHAARQALPHLVAEEADADALQVLGGDLQRTEEGWLVSVALAGVGTDAPRVQRWDFALTLEL